GGELDGLFQHVDALLGLRPLTEPQTEIIEDRDTLVRLQAGQVSRNDPASPRIFELNHQAVGKSVHVLLALLRLVLRSQELVNPAKAVRRNRGFVGRDDQQVVEGSGYDRVAARQQAALEGQ